MIEPIVFESIAKYIGKLQENESVFNEIENNQNQEKKRKQAELKKEKQTLKSIQDKILIMEKNIPNAMTGDYPLSLEELVAIIKKHKEQEQQQQDVVTLKEMELKTTSVSINEWEDIKNKIPTWQDVFLNADVATKRVLVNKLVERIDVKKSEVVIRFKINLNDLISQPRICGDSPTTPYTLDSE